MSKFYLIKCTITLKYAPSDISVIFLLQILNIFCGEFSIAVLDSSSKFLVYLIQALSGILKENLKEHINLIVRLYTI